MKVAIRSSMLVAVLWMTMACGSAGAGQDVSQDASCEQAEAAQEQPLLSVEVGERPPLLRLVDRAGAVVAESRPGILRLASVETTCEARLGFLAFTRDEQAVWDFADGGAQVESGAGSLRVTLRDALGIPFVFLEVRATPTGVLLLPTLLEAAGGANEVRFRFTCRDDEAFYGFGGQNDAVDHRGETVPVRTSEQGLDKDPDLPEGTWSPQGHLHDTYFPLPYALVATSGPEARAHGLLLESSRRSRWLLGSEEPGVTEVQVARRDLQGLHVLAGPTPSDVVRQYTDLHGRPNPLPDWAFAPWVALFGEPAEILAQAPSLDQHDVPLGVVWHMDFRDYDHPGLPAMIDGLHSMGLRVLTYFNSFVYGHDPFHDLAVAEGYLPTREDGTPFELWNYDSTVSVVDLTNPAAWAWMRGRLEQAWDLGLDGWMADYGEWVDPAMRFADGRDGWQYGNLYPVDWARLNDETLRDRRPAGDALFFSRSGYLDSNRHLRVTWAGDQQTDWSLLDGLASVIPYGTGLGLAGVSAFGHDIAGYTGGISPPSTRELYFRWTELGAWSPVMRTHRGAQEQKNWDWNRDPGTIAHFRAYSLLHLRLLPYLEALHAQAMESGLPAMRSVLLEFPAWEGAREAVHEYLLGPAFFVAPVIMEGATSREVRLPPGRWYRFPEGLALEGDRVVLEPAPLEAIPVFLRAGAVVPLLPDQVRRVEPVPGHPEVPTARELVRTRLEVLVGAGAPGTFGLVDGTRLSAEPTGDAEEALEECGAGQDPWQVDCARTVGRERQAPLTGPGSRVLAGMRVTVESGPAARRHLLRVVSTAGETATQAAWRTRLDDLRLENTCAPVELDAYGGWKNAPASLGQPEPGQWFRVARRGGAWWFITPDGHPYLSKGVTDVTWQAFQPGGDADPQVAGKYAGEDAWGDAAEARLKAWRFNSVGPWSSPSMGGRVPHASVILDSAMWAPKYTPESVLTDFWSEGFAQHAARVAEERAGPLVDDRWLLGFFLDNELPWEPNWATELTVLQLCAGFPADAPGRIEALQFLREQAGTLDAFQATWGKALADWDSLQDLTSKELAPGTEAARAVTQAFQVHAFRRYAEVAVAALRAVDPHHLVLGCRFFSYPGDALFLEAAQHFDVISLAYYWDTPPVPDVDRVWPQLDKPVFLEEFSFKARDSGLPNVWNFAPVVETQEDRALAYDAYVRAWMERPYAVGYHWYKWLDNPLVKENPFRGDNFGLLDSLDEPYLPLVTLAAEVNGRVEAWHSQTEVR
jgi:alpha-glucosidase (family GH31 glycosyl hydrolase)